jgi:hypothetical protein
MSEISIIPSTLTLLTAGTVLSEVARELSHPSTHTLISDSDEGYDLPNND